MRFTAFALTSLILAVACANWAGRSRHTDAFVIQWERTTIGKADDARPILLVPQAALLDRSVSATFAHPIVADAANTLFRPLLTSEANASLRLTNREGNDLTPAIPLNAGVGPTIRAMAAALRVANRPVPDYLTLVADEYAPAGRETVRFAVTCYWKGEQRLGALPGVIATRTGSLGDEEILEAEFDPTLVSRETLAGHAQEMACFQRRVDDTIAKLDDSNQQQYHLWLNKAWHYVPLTRLQATRVNAAIVARETPDRFLSPTQIAIQRRLQRRHDRDPRGLDMLESLHVDRTAEGIVVYANALLSRLR